MQNKKVRSSWRRGKEEEKIPILSAASQLLSKKNPPEKHLHLRRRPLSYSLSLSPPYPPSLLNPLPRGNAPPDHHPFCLPGLRAPPHSRPGSARAETVQIFFSAFCFFFWFVSS